jgi:hypothetical protein
MKRNMGLIDRIIRITFAVIVGLLFFTGQLTGIAAIILGILSVVFLITGALGLCPLYLPLNLSTRKGDK